MKKINRKSLIPFIAAFGCLLLFALVRSCSSEKASVAAKPERPKQESVFAPLLSKTEEAKSAEETKPAEEAKPTEEAKSAEETKPVEEPKPDEEAKREIIYVPMLPQEAVADGVIKIVKEGTEQPAQEKTEDPKVKKREAMTALFAINHINWVVTKIKSYNNPAVLEEEYNALTADALDLRVIKDPEIIDLICQILDTITEMRIEETERNFIKDELDQGKAEALSNAIGSISISGMNPLSMVANAITSAATAAMNYRKAKLALAAKFKRQNWELDKHRLNYLNELNKELLRNFWQLVQKYPDLPDQYRVSEKDIQLLVDHLKDEDAVKRHEFLKSFKEQFAAFQPYWYHRGAAAYEVSRMTNLPKERREMALEDAEAALRSFVRLQDECGSVIRKDAIAAKAALLLATIMAEKKTGNEDDYRMAITVAMKNAAPDDWQTAYFCAVLAVQELQDVRLADEILNPVISELDWQKRRRLVDWKDQAEIVAEIAKKAQRDDNATTNKVAALIPAGDALYECKTLIARIGEKQLKNEEYLKRLRAICEDQNASVRDKLYSYGAMGYKQFLEKLSPDIEKMRMTVKGDEYAFSVPFSWVIARSPLMQLKLGEKTLDISSHAIDEREDGAQYAKIIYKRTDETKKMSGDFSFISEFKIGKDSYWIIVVFSGKDKDNDKPRKPIAAFMGKLKEDRSGWTKKPSADGKGEVDDIEIIEFAQ